MLHNLWFLCSFFDLFYILYENLAFNFVKDRVRSVETAKASVLHNFILKMPHFKLKVYESTRFIFICICADEFENQFI